METETRSKFEEAAAYERELNARQREVLRLLAGGYTNAQIGERCGISLDGAKWNVSEILGKLGLDSREEAAGYFRWRSQPRRRLTAPMRALAGFAATKWLAAGSAAIVAVGIAAVAGYVVFNRGSASPSGSARPTSAVATSAPTSTVAALQTPPLLPIVLPGDRVYVIGRDTTMDVTARLPVACVDQPVQLSLFLRDGATPRNISPFPGSAVVPATAGRDASLAATIPLPTTLGAPVRAWPGVTGSCLSSPALDSTVGAEFAVADAKANPASSSSVLVSPAGLASFPNANPETFGALVGSLTVFADGKECTSASTDPAVTHGANVVLHLGAVGQPPECSRAGATLTFRNAAGTELFITMTLIPGATQLLENFAVQAPVDGPYPAPPVPLAPTP